MENLKYPLIRRAIAETSWAILPSKLAEITEFMAIKAAGGDVSAEEIRERFGPDSDRKAPKSPDKIAILPVYGTISRRVSLLSEASGGTSTDKLQAQFRALVNDPEIDAIVLDVDSPGGDAAGIAEFADEIYRARGTKPITAVANSLMASAAYWIAASADEIVASPSAKLGSIGVLAAHEDQSAFYDKMGVKISLVSAGKYKSENNPLEPLSDEGRAEIQKRVNETYGMFVDAVARGRGTTAKAVRDGFGQGRVVGAREAVTLGMADRTATLDEVIATIPTPSQQGSGESARHMGLVAVSYEAHGQRVLADLSLFTRATRDRIDYRQADGRTLSAAQREQLAAIQAGLTDAAGQMATLLAASEPVDEQAVRAARLEAAARRLRLHDVDLLLAETEGAI